jgi:hypothetical protein
MGGHVRSRTLLLVALTALVMGLAVPSAVGLPDPSGWHPPSTESPSSPLIDGDAWPAATALFASDPCWWSADGAYSIQLGPERFLYTFGDSLVYEGACGVRSNFRFVNNTVAIQTGTNPATASMAFAKPTDAGGHPRSFFLPPGPDQWYWPIDGVRIGNKLFVALAHLVRNDINPPPWNFGWGGNDVAVINNPDDPPSAWTPTYVDLPDGPQLPAGDPIVIEHRGFLVHGDYLLGYVSGDAGAALLRRWPLTDVARTNRRPISPACRC